MSTTFCLCGNLCRYESGSLGGCRAGAEASINKAASLGLVVGETRNGKTYFRPRDSVSLSESCQLAYKLLMQTGKAKADDSVTQKWTPIMNAYGIQSWAYPAVSYCLENGILATSNLSGFMKTVLICLPQENRQQPSLGAP